VAVGMRRPNPSGAHAEAAPGAAALFDRYSQRLHAYCLYMLRDRAEAEDAVQTTFLQALRALQRGVAPENEYAWLHSIAKNVCRTQQRTTGRRARVVTGVDMGTIPDGREAVGDQLELQQSLGAALASLPERQRRALILREWHGLSSDEVAAQLDMSAPATYALLTRGRRSLAAALSTTVRRPISSLNIGVLVDLFRTHLKTLLGGAASKTATASVVVVTASVGGVIAQQSYIDDSHRATTSKPFTEHRTPIPVRGSTGPAQRSAPAARSARRAIGRVELVAAARQPVPRTHSASTGSTEPVEPKVAPGEQSAAKPEQHPVPATDPVPVPQPPPTPPVPELSADNPLDPLVPLVENPPLPPLPELPPVEVPPVELPKLPAGQSLPPLLP
jgi:RNA polymerase sigma factor (sigma-70 family)